MMRKPRFIVLHTATITLIAFTIPLTRLPQPVAVVGRRVDHVRHEIDANLVGRVLALLLQRKAQHVGQSVGHFRRAKEGADWVFGGECIIRVTQPVE